MPSVLNVVDSGDIGARLDLFLTRNLSPAPAIAVFSRSAIQKMILEGCVTLNRRAAKPGARLKLNDMIEIRWPLPRETSLQPEPLPLDIHYEDDDCLVVNKSAGMVVHPAAGRWSGTLVNALLYHCPDIQGIGGERRPGIVHRLDKDTSGVMVVAKHGRAFHYLATQFRERKIRKEYLALVWGRVQHERGIINRPIGRHRTDRKRMSSRHSISRLRAAITEWRVEDCFRVGPDAGSFSRVTWLRLRPFTGRTHQIRVHLADQGYPIVGDRIYGRKRQTANRKAMAPTALAEFPRQALHAEKIAFIHPATGQVMEFRAPLPSDLQRLLDQLRKRRTGTLSRQADVGG